MVYALACAQCIVFSPMLSLESWWCHCVACSQGQPGPFADYLKQYKNTICGRHPIGVLLNVSGPACFELEVVGSGCTANGTANQYVVGQAWHYLAVAATWSHQCGFVDVLLCRCCSTVRRSTRWSSSSMTNRASARTHKIRACLTPPLW